MVAPGNQTLAAEFWRPAVELAIDAGCCNVYSKIAITAFALLRDNCCRREEPHCHFATFRFIRCRIAFQLDDSLKLAIMHILAIVGTNPQSEQMKLNLSLWQLQDFKAVGSLRVAESVVTGDCFRWFRGGRGLRDQRLCRKQTSYEQANNGS